MNYSTKTETMILWLFAILSICAFSWLGYTDKKLDIEERATLKDRIHTHCQTFPHDRLCLTIKKENEDN